MNNTEVVLGIDIGGTKSAFGFVNRSGEIIVGGTIPTLAKEPAATLVARLHTEIKTAKNALSPEYQLKGIGIGAPNANYYRGTVENPVNLHWGESTDLVELFHARFDLPVVITNDANAAAIGEMLFGGAKGMKDFIVITLGTGLGSGIVVHGELLYGASGFAGELGHTIVDPQGRECACGKKGCLETYVSATGLCRTLFVLLGESTSPSPLRARSYQELTAKEIFTAAHNSDPIALAAFDTTARILAMKLADAVAHTSPETIFLFGGLASAGDLLLLPTRRYLEGFLFTPYRGTVNLLLSSLKEGSAAIQGAAGLIWNELGVEKKF